MYAMRGSILSYAMTPHGHAQARRMRHQQTTSEGTLVKGYLSERRVSQFGRVYRVRNHNTHLLWLQTGSCNELPM